MATRRTLTDSPFDALEKTFRLLVIGPRPLALEGEVVVGLPERLTPLDELKAILLHPSTSYQVRDDTLAELIRQARASESWKVGLAAAVLPGVRSVVWSLVQACPDKAEDIEAETLAGLGDIDVSRPRLVWRSRKAAKRLVRLELAEQGRPATSPVPGAPPEPWGAPRPSTHRGGQQGRGGGRQRRADRFNPPGRRRPRRGGHGAARGLLGRPQAPESGRGGRGRVAGLRRSPLPALCPKGSGGTPFSWCGSTSPGTVNPIGDRRRVARTADQGRESAHLDLRRSSCYQHPGQLAPRAPRRRKCQTPAPRCSFP